jgi:pyrroline-5-carboxylate reductase
MRVGIIGCGKLGRAIASGLLAHGAVREIVASTRSAQPIPSLPTVAIHASNCAVAHGADVVFLCVKPAHVKAVVEEIASSIDARSLVISTAAAIDARDVCAWLEGRAPVVRVMPNMPCRIGEGMTVIARGPHSKEEHVALAESLFAPLGRTAVIPEHLMDAATAISGCGPAYGYVILEALMDAAVTLGLPYDVARLLTAQTMRGAAQMVLASDAHPAELKSEIATPGGCTVDALLELETGGLRSTLLRAVLAAAARSAALGRPVKTPSYS